MLLRRFGCISLFYYLNVHTSLGWLLKSYLGWIERSRTTLNIKSARKLQIEGEIKGARKIENMRAILSSRKVGFLVHLIHLLSYSDEDLFVEMSTQCSLKRYSFSGSR